MTMQDVRDDLLGKRLKNVEMHARAFLSASGKASLKKIEDALAPKPANPTAPPPVSK